jgi:hypothetical protein
VRLVIPWDNVPDEVRNATGTVFLDIAPVSVKENGA